MLIRKLQFIYHPRINTIWYIILLTTITLFVSFENPLHGLILLGEVVLLFPTLMDFCIHFTLLIIHLQAGNAEMIQCRTLLLWLHFKLDLQQTLVSVSFVSISSCKSCASFTSGVYSLSKDCRGRLLDFTHRPSILPHYLKPSMTWTFGQ